MKVGVVGASGYVGGEILRLLVSHPHAEISMVTSRQYVGEYISRIQPSLKGFTDMTFSELDYDKLTDKCDLVFTAVPHGTAVDIVKALYDRGMKVIDLSADYRLHNPADYDKWYGWQHPHPELLEKSVFGVPELHREEIKKSQIVSCPGCMAVTSILGLYPLIKKKIIDTEHIIVDSKIGSSGAGAGTVSGTHHAMRSGVIRPYKPAKHRHTGEIEQELSIANGGKIKVSMSPHAVDIVRGILCTNHVFLNQPVSEMDLWKIYREQYQNEKFIRLIRDKKGFYKFPDPKFVVGSNFCDVGFDIDEDNNRIVVLSASDNLMKGAAGSAIQNMNVMAGFNEMEGIAYSPLTPV
ncbi:N-acetyl-gamma-glutamyl-phosphate/N-acetyl-gamma-aminoadipyl-phosphate reductase [Nitrosotalea devaniterrae]|uniref:Putative [LysW]-L-2-aminoadipate/[LysW]-L-glutamate phosphate reductase n=1 Tax=Nitrosotalea devaniterrae TaxID=1078905 RepID=A0A128A4U5_9ARCH|nr:N-acetyl-gamma-glutamyl-phosphate/N-acetyl-gamma-aminoadipyl-phosphate reductase [Candidatus Nitrosotalea devanaterra]